MKPWKWSRVSTNGIKICGSDGEEVATIINPYTDTTKRDKRIARLICKAVNVYLDREESAALQAGERQP